MSEAIHATGDDDIDGMLLADLTCLCVAWSCKHDDAAR